MYRLIYVEAVLIWYIAFMKGTAALENATDYDPDVHFLYTVESPRNPAFYFFFTVLWMFIFGSFQYLFRQVFRFAFPIAYIDFKDLCCVANLSLFIFDQQFHGYYIHGQFPGETADVTLERLKLLLDEEENGDRAL